MSEALLHEQITQYLHLQFPNSMFYTTMDGIRLPMGLASKAKKLRNPATGWPDLILFEPRGGFVGMALEIKREGTTIYLRNGQLSADPHIREQETMLQKLRDRGFYAEFGIGFEASKALLDNYLTGHTKTPELQ